MRSAARGEGVGPAPYSLLSVREVRDLDGRNRGKAEQLGGLDPPMTGHDLTAVIDKHRIGESKASDAVGDLPDLLLRMGPGIVPVGDQPE